MDDIDRIQLNKMIAANNSSNAEYTYVFLNKNRYVFKNKLLKKVVDTSGAGDGFNAAYLSNFIVNNDPLLALKAGSSLGSKIVMKKGAIVDVK